MNRNCLDVDDVVKAGPGLSFIAYPEAIGLLPVCQLFSGNDSMYFLALYRDGQHMVAIIFACNLGHKRD